MEDPGARARFLGCVGAEMRSRLDRIIAELDSFTIAPQPGVPWSPTQAAPDRIQQATEIATTEAKRLLPLVESILDVARLEVGQLELAEDVVEVPALIRACLRPSGKAAAAAEVALVVDLPESLPRIRCDERRIQEALERLIGNAIRATPPAGSVSISARQAWTSGDLLFRVQESGPTGAGTGEEPAIDAGQAPAAPALGLYISSAFVRAHGGGIELRNAEGHATTAILRIPADRVLQDGSRDPN